MIEIVNRQRAQPIPRSLNAFAERARSAVDKTDKTATIVFVSDAAIKKLNRQFRGKNYATDVLSFPTQAEEFEFENQSHLGEVVISTQRAAAQAKENGLTFRNEVQQLILHGLLHLCGYDHETDDGEMNRLELKLRKQLGI
jgi:probable rRNA maturation factor